MTSRGRTRGATLANEAEYDQKKAKQRASIKWLLSKAYNHKTPDELKEPFYKNHDEVEHLKPHITHALANAELYCMALSNLYQDPNFHNLNHWGIIQALARKGVFVAEPADCSLTETVLIQTNPLKMSAHMAVTEALMSLFLKEMFPLDKILGVCKRFEKAVVTSSLSDLDSITTPTDQEEGLLFWLGQACQVLKAQTEEEVKDSSNPPTFPKVNHVSDLSDGTGLASLISLYSPDNLKWTDIALGDPPSMADSLYNIQIVQRFCKDSLPFNCCHLTIEDFVYSHASIRQNVVCFLADLFFLFEVKPFKSSLNLPGIEKTQIIDVPDPDAHRIKSSTEQRRQSSQEKSDRHNSPNEDSSFVVQRGRTVPTLSSVVSKPETKELLNRDSKNEELGEVEDNRSEGNVFQKMKSIPVAGRPSDTPKRSSIYSAGSGSGHGGGRLSRRNSIDENASQLSVENLGGSQDNLHMLGRNPDKEMRTHSGRKGVIDNRDMDKQAKDEINEMQAAGQSKINFAEIRKKNARDMFHSSGINMSFNDDLDDEGPSSNEGRTSLQRRSSLLDRQQRNKLKDVSSPASNNSSVNNGNQNLSGSVPAAPNLTSWASKQNQQQNQQPNISDAEAQNNSSTSPDAMASQLNNVRLKLELRRKRIEEEKKKMENIMARQREKDLTEDLSAVQAKWLSNERPGRSSMDNARTPDVEGMDMDTYAKNLHAMNDSLHDLQSDIQRLASQQSQIQQMMHGNNSQGSPGKNSNLMEPQPFFISQDQVQHQVQHQPPTQRRTWGQPQPISFAHQEQPHWSSPRRQQWGQPMAPPPNPGYGYGPTSNPQYNDVYNNQMRDSYGAMNYNGGGSPYDRHPYGYNAGPGYSPNYGGYGMAQPTPPPPPQSVTSPYGHTSYMSPTSVNTSMMASPSRNAPFRLHDQPLAASEPPLTAPKPHGLTSSSPMSPSALQSMRNPSAITDSASPMLMKHSHRVQSPTGAEQSRLHTSVPAPEEDDMAPQNISFIESSAEDEADRKSTSPVPDALKRLPERLSQLNISSGTKTYRVHKDSDAKSPSPSPTRNRPSISSTFKQNRRGSGGETSGPASLRSNPQLPTAEEEEALANMKTERLKDDKDAAAGFVISFDDDSKPKKAKPMLKERRMSNKKASMSEFSSDGSSSSRKENVPPDVMICIDMNIGSDEGGAHHGRGPYRKYSPIRNGSSSIRNMDSSSWNDYDQDGPSGNNKFEIDPEVPLEAMVPIGGHRNDEITSESESDGQPKGLLIGDELLQADPLTQDEMQRKKERIMLQSLRRKQEQEENRIRREEELRKREEKEKQKEEEKLRKKEEEKARRDAILEQHRIKKEMDKMEDQGRYMPNPVSARPVPKLRPAPGGRPSVARPRPKTIHVDQDADMGTALASSRGKRGSTSNMTGLPRSDSRNSINDVGRTGGYGISGMGSRNPRTPGSRRGSTSYLNDEHNARDYRGSRESLNSGLTYSARRGSNASVYEDNDYYYGGSMRDLSNRHTGRRKSSSASHLGPGSLPGYRRRGDFDDGASDISSTSGFSAYGYRSGTRLYREPAAKSNRTMILNAIEYVVFPGVVNRDTRERVMDVVDRCDCPHFLLLFRDQKCQFRGLYAYYPDTEEVYKIYGTGPKQVTDKMFEFFFKYNSGGKKFTKIHTKSLTVTIDGFTIHNSLWLGKKAKLPNKKDMALVI